MRADRREMYTVLKELARVVPTRGTSPIIEQVHLVARDGFLTLTTTDINRRLTCQIPATGELRVCLPCKQLTQAIKPEGRGDAGLVELHAQGDRISVCVDGLTSTMNSADPDDFPQVSTKNQELIGLWPARPLREALEFVLPAASRDETRPHLCTVLMQDYDLVATDGHRLHLAPLPAPLAGSLLLSASAAATLARMLQHGDQAILARTSDVLRVKCGTWQLDAHLSDLAFPPYKQVIPTMNDQPIHIQAQAALFNKAVVRVARLTRDKRLKLCINGVISMSTWDAEAGVAQSQVPVVQSNHQGDDLHIGFDAPYLTQAIPKDVDLVQLGFDGPLAPLRVDLDGGRVAVVMPLRLD